MKKYFSACMLAPAAFTATVLLGGCAVPEWTPESAAQAAATETDADDMTTGSRLKSKDPTRKIGIKNSTDAATAQPGSTGNTR